MQLLAKHALNFPRPNNWITYIIDLPIAKFFSSPEFGTDIKELGYFTKPGLSFRKFESLVLNSLESYLKRASQPEPGQISDDKSIPHFTHCLKRTVRHSSNRIPQRLTVQMRLPFPLVATKHRVPKSVGLRRLAVRKNRQPLTPTVA